MISNLPYFFYCERDTNQPFLINTKFIAKPICYTGLRFYYRLGFRDRIYLPIDNQIGEIMDEAVTGTILEGNPRLRAYSKPIGFSNTTQEGTVIDMMEDLMTGEVWVLVNWDSGSTQKPELLGRDVTVVPE